MDIYLDRIFAPSAFGEKVGFIFGRNADTGVSDGKHYFAVLFRESDNNLARGRVSNGVFYKITKNMLGELVLVADDGKIAPLGDIYFKFQSFLLRIRSEILAKLQNKRFQIKTFSIIRNFSAL